MESLRTGLLAGHIATLAALFVLVLTVAIAPGLTVGRRGIAISAVVMGLTGIALIGVRVALDLGNNGPKLGVKAAVLIGIVVLARLVARVPPTHHVAVRGLLGGIAALAVANTAIAVGWS